jgi:membrane-associated protein
MRYLTYLTYDIFGGTLWISSMLLGGYIAGSRIPNISKYLHLIIGAIIFLSILPPIIGILRSWRSAGNTVPVADAPLPEAESK